MNSGTDGYLGNFLLPVADLLAQEAQQSGVHFFRVGPGDGVRSIFHHQLARSFDELGGAKACGRYGKNAVGISLNHERGHVDARQVFAEVFMPRCDARETGGSGGAGRNVPTGLYDLFADTLSQECVGVVEILKETGEERIPVSSYRLLYSCEHATIHALGVVRRLQQARWHTGNNHGFAHTLGAVFSEVACDFAPSHREADQDEVSQLKLGDQLVKVFYKRVVVVASGRLAGFAEAPAIVGDDPVTRIQQHRYLLLPRGTA